MTAIDKYIRLEAIGKWRSGPNEPTREVVVSFGNATLQLTGLDDTPLSHWALRAVKRIGSKGSGIIYSADSQGDETLLIDDAEMIRAITAVTFEIGQAKPAKSRFKKFAWLGVLLATIILLSQSPPLIYTWAVKLTSPVRMQEFSEQMQTQLFQSTDFTCTDSRATRALADFSQALFSDFPPRIVVLKGDANTASGLSDSFVYLSVEPVLAAENASVLAAMIAVDYAMSQRRALLYQTVQNAGPLAGIKHIFGQNITAELPITNATPNAEDFIAARNRLQDLRIDTKPLQELAAQYGFGLPLDANIVPQNFETETFAAIQQHCKT